MTDITSKTNRQKAKGGVALYRIEIRRIQSFLEEKEMWLGVCM